MELQDIVSKLPDEEKAVVLSAIEAEKNRGIVESQKKGVEVKRHMTEANKIKDAIKNTFDIDITDLDKLPDALSQFKTKTVNTSEYVSRKDFALLQKQLDDEKAAREAVDNKLRNAKITEGLNSVLGDSFHAKDLLIKNLLAAGQVRMTESDQIVYVNGDEEMDMAKGIEHLKKQRPDLVKNTSRPGSGSAGGGKDKSKDGKITYDEFTKLDPVAQRDYMTVHKGFSG